MSSIKYRPEIDGLRAIAVIPVLLFHLGMESMSGGFIGVDVFFVISGFLITMIILKEYDQEKFSLKEFWFRRIKRILPPLLFMLAIVSAVTFLFFDNGEIIELGKEGTTALISVSNFRFLRVTDGSWGETAETLPLLHTWSLAVEEQFYLFFPLLLFAVLKLRRQWVIPIIFILIAGSLAYFIYGCSNDPHFTFYMLPTRIWELGSGCLLAIVLFQKSFQPSKNFSPRIKAALTNVGLVAILATAVFLKGTDNVTPYLIIPIMGALLIIGYGEDTPSLTKSLLSHPFMVYIGKISYPLYLWHWPVIVLSKSYYLGDAPIYSPWLVVPLFIIAAVGSYHLLEKPIRKKEKVVAPILACVGGMILVSFLLTTVPKGDYSQFQITYLNSEYSVQPDPGRRHDDPTPEILTAYANGGVIKDHSGTGIPQVVVLGDSHAVMWSKVIDEVCAELKLTVSYNGCGGESPFFSVNPKETPKRGSFSTEERIVWEQKRIEYIKQWKPKLVIIGCRWTGSRSGDELLTFLEELGTKVVMIEQPPLASVGKKYAANILAQMNIQPEEGKQFYRKILETEQYENGAAACRRYVEMFENCDMLPTVDRFTKGDEVAILSGNRVLYQDDDHITYEGSLLVKDRFVEKISECFPAKSRIASVKDDAPILK